MAGSRDDGTFAENKANHPNRKVSPDVASANRKAADVGRRIYSLLPLDEPKKRKPRKGTN